MIELHQKNAAFQRQAFNKDRNHLDKDLLTVVMDFKENIKINGIGIIQRGEDFYDRIQISCFGCASYTSLGSDTVVHYHDFLSTNLTHDSTFVKGCIEKLLERVEQKKLRFWFDCGNHFRNYELLYDLMCNLPPRFEDVAVNFFIEQHGKSPVDAHFSQISNTIDRKSKLQEIDDITTLSSVLQSNLKNTTVHIYDLIEQPPQITQAILTSDGNSVNIQENYCFRRIKSFYCFSTLSYQDMTMFRVAGVLKTNTRVNRIAPQLDTSKKQKEKTIGVRQKLKLSRIARKIQKK